jgi:Putative auto-transporter adhesin, head GIN domain
MKQLLLFFSITSAVIFSSCNKELIRGAGSIGTRSISLPAFTAVESHYDIKAVISYGATQEVTATGYDNLLNILDFKVENGVLKLKFNTTYNTIRNGNIVANIKIPVLSATTIHGSQSIESTACKNSRQWQYSYKQQQLPISFAGSIWQWEY